MLKTEYHRFSILILFSLWTLSDFHFQAEISHSLSLSKVAISFIKFEHANSAAFEFGKHTVTSTYT